MFLRGKKKNKREENGSESKAKCEAHGFVGEIETEIPDCDQFPPYIRLLYVLCTEYLKSTHNA